MKALGALTVNPSKILGLEAGELIAGRDADFVIFDMSVAGRIHSGLLQQQNSLFEEDRSKDEFEDYQEW